LVTLGPTDAEVGAETQINLNQPTAENVKQAPRSWAECEHPYHV